MLYFSHSLTLLTFCQCYWFRSLMNLVGNFVGTAFVQFKTKKQADECIRVSSSFQVNGHFFWFWIIVMVFLGLFVIIHGISWKKWCRKRKLFKWHFCYWIIFCSLGLRQRFVYFTVIVLEKVFSLSFSFISGGSCTRWQKTRCVFGIAKASGEWPEDASEQREGWQAKPSSDPGWL